MNRERIFGAVGELRPAYEAVDWGATAIGAVESWSPALSNAVDVALRTQFPATLLWGPELVLVYNAAYAGMIADKHPSALGAPAQAVFPEAWDAIGPMLRGVLAGGGPTWVEDTPLPLQRRGILEEAHFSFSYSPVHGPDGRVEGVLDVATETTRQVIDRRRLDTLNRLAEALAGVESVDDVRARTLEVLRGNAADMPAVDIVAAGAEAGFGPGRVARLPLGRGRERRDVVVRLSEHLAHDERYFGFLRLVASTLAPAIDRIRSHEAERGLTEALQRSLLSPPPQPDHLQVAVRYRPASAGAKVGGDWYDAFVDPDGSLALVVGDVTGHDQRAAAAMAQLRNLVRGLTYTLRQSPARVLLAVDEAMRGLSAGLYATAILARVEQDEADAEIGLRRLRWSNAGHPPPLLLDARGGVRTLEADPEPLLGVGGERFDHTVALEPGSTVIMYTDGLVERRDVALDVGLARLGAALEGCEGMPPKALCDHLIAELDGESEDDVALVALRVAGG